MNAADIRPTSPLVSPPAPRQPLHTAAAGSTVNPPPATANNAPPGTTTFATSHPNAPPTTTTTTTTPQPSTGTPIPGLRPQVPPAGAAAPAAPVGAAGAAGPAAGTAAGAAAGPTPAPPSAATGPAAGHGMPAGASAATGPAAGATAGNVPPAGAAGAAGAARNYDLFGDDDYDMDAEEEDAGTDVAHVLSVGQPALTGPSTIMDKVEQAIQGQAHKHAAGTVIETASFKQTWVHEQHSREVVVPDREKAQPMSVIDLMPAGEAEEVRQSDKDTIANSQRDSNCIDFLMVVKTTDDQGEALVHLPRAETFEELASKANWQLMDESALYCLVVEDIKVNDQGLGIIVLDYQDNGTGAERYRAILRGFSTPELGVETYPVADLLKRYALTIYLHRQHSVPDHRIGECIKIHNQGLKGSFTIIFNKKIKTGPRTGSRILSLSASEEFLQSLAQFDRNHRFRLSNKRFYITGGIRKDSSPSAPLPPLPTDQVTSLLHGNMAKIIDIANQQLEERSRHLSGQGRFREDEL